MTLRVKFWGVRGSIACPQPAHMRYGGNTSCIEVFAGEHRTILDAGTGIRLLGQEFLRENVMLVDLLLTHTHWDHINGFPFFVPAYDPRRTLHIMAGHLTGKASIQDVLSAQMDNPMFPIPLGAMQSSLKIEDFVAGDSFDLRPDLHVRTAPLRHPNGATAYRIEHGGKSVCYVTDTEHIPGRPDESILALIDGTDLVIYDCTYTEEEFPAKVSWGHSTWNEGVRLCQMANAKQLAIFHHDPEHDDDFMDAIAVEAKELWENTFVAHEGMEVVLG